MDKTAQKNDESHYKVLIELLPYGKYGDSHLILQQPCQLNSTFIPIFQFGELMIGGVW